MIEQPDGERVIAQAAGLPLRSAVGSGAEAPVDLALRPVSEGFEAANPVVPFEIATTGEVRLPDSNVSAHVLGDVADPTEIHDRLFYPDVLTDTDLVLSPSPLGVQLAFQVRSTAAPESAVVQFDLPAGARLRRALPDTAADAPAPDGRLDVVKGDDVVASVMPPVGWDADGVEVNVEYEIQGSRLVVRFPHRDKDLHYPLFIDPDLNGGTYGSGGSAWPASGAGGWVWQTTGGGLFASSVSNGYRLIQNAPGFNLPDGVYGQWLWTPSAGFGVVSAAFGGIHHVPPSGPVGTHMCGLVALWYGSPSYYGGTDQTYCAAANWASHTAQGTSPALQAAYAYSADGAGSRATGSLYLLQVIFTVRDNTAPRITSAAPPANDWRDPAEPGFEWTWTGDDTGTKVKRFRFERDTDPGAGSTWAYVAQAQHSCSATYPGTCPGTWSADFTWLNSVLSEGTNTGRVRIEDAQGNVSPWTVYTIKGDKNPPTYGPDVFSGALWDRRGKLVSTSQPLTLKVRDAYSGVEWTKFLVDGAVAAGPFTETCTGTGAAKTCKQTDVIRSFTFNPAGRADGKHTIDGQAKDALGHTRTSMDGGFDVLVDNTAPSEPSLTHADQPDAGTWWDGTAAVTATTSDQGTAPAGDWGSGIERLELLDGDDVIATKSYTCTDTIAGRCRESESPTFTYSGASDAPAGAVQLAEGVRTLSVRAVDKGATFQRAPRRGK